MDDDLRKEIDSAAKTSGYAARRFSGVVIASIVVLALVGFGLNSLGLFGRTVVERKVFENSYQRSEALKSQVATEEATLAEIDRKLSNPNLDPDTRTNLEAQASAARIRLNTARSKQ